jgi:hypothetical protein
MRVDRKPPWLWVRKAAAPATVTGEILKQPLTEKVGKARIGGETLLRKPGDLPAPRNEPADGVFRDGERIL